MLQFKTEIQKPIFCYKCHKPVQIPEMVKENQIKIQSFIKIGCPCGGHAKYKPNN